MIKLFPHYAINVRDDSLQILSIVETLPLFRPLYSLKTESGPVGVPVWCNDLATAKKIFGKSTLDKHNPTYYSRASAFLNVTLPHCGAFITRIDSPPLIEEGVPGTPMAAASQVLYFNYNEDAGIQNMWYTMEPLDGIDPVSLDVSSDALGDVEVDTYKVAVMLVASKYPGAYGNQLGFSLSHGVKVDSEGSFYNSGVMDFAEIDRLKTYKYTIGFHELDSITATGNVLRTKYSTKTFDFAVESDVVDPSINASIGYDIQEDRNFGDTYPAPMDVTVFENNIKYIVGIFAGIATAKNLPDIATYLDENKSVINIFTITTQRLVNGVEECYDIGSGLGIVLEPAAADPNEATISPNTIHYLAGGNNGDLDVDDIDNSTIIDAALIDVFSLNKTPEMEDNAHYPFNMPIDTGYSMSVKEAIISLNGIRGDTKPVLTTWSGTDQTMATSIAAGIRLDTTLRGYKESEIFATQAFRGIIFGQYGQLYRDDYIGNIPMTLWYVERLARMHNRTFIADNPEAKTAKNTLFRPDTINYTPFTDMQKSNLWAASVNYCQHYDQKGLHFPGLRSVYEYESSLFTNDAYVNMCIYVKQIFPRVWSNYASSSEPDADVYGMVLQDLDAELLHLLHGKAESRTHMYQTAAEALTGFEHHVAVTLLDNLGQRIWNIDLIGERL